MMKTYTDKQYMTSKYRAAIMFRTVGIIIVIVAIAGFAFPYDGGFIVCAVCGVMIIAGFLYQILIDRTIVYSGTWLVDDGKYLYTMVGAFNFGFGRSHHYLKTIKTQRVSSIEQVLKVREYAFGIAIKAKVYTKKFDHVDEELFDTPGAMRDELIAHGKSKTMLFRLERNLEYKSEAKLLDKLERLERAA